VKKKIWLATISSLISLLVAWASAEVYLRRNEQPQNQLVPLLYTHNGVQISSVPSLVKLSLAPFTVYKNLPSHVDDFFINSRGLRAEEGVERDVAPKIVLLGGSAAFGLTVRSNRDTIAYLLEPRVQPYKVLNAGVSGFLSGQELTYLVTELVDYHPAVVVAYDGWNDLFDAVYQPRAQDEFGFNSNFFQIENQLVANYQSLHSSRLSFNRFLSATYPKSRVLTRFIDHFGHQQRPELVANAVMLPSALNVYTSNLRKMDRFSRAFNAEFVVVFQAELGQKLHRTALEQQQFDAGVIGANNYSREFPGLYKQFIAQAKERLTREGIEWIDANENSRIKDATDELFSDIVHTNRRGNETVAAILSERLLQLAKRKKGLPFEDR